MTSIEYVTGLVRTKHLDRCTLHDASGRQKLGDANGAEDIAALLSGFPLTHQGSFMVRVWKGSANAGRKGIDANAYTFTCVGTAQAAAVATPAGSHWMERFFELKMEHELDKLKAQYEEKPDPLEKYLPFIQGVLPHLLKGGTGAPMQGHAPATSVPADAPTNGAPDPELRAMLLKVAQLYKKDPSVCREVMPPLDTMLNANGSS